MRRKKSRTMGKIKSWVVLAVMLLALLFVYSAPPDKVRALFLINLKQSRCWGEQKICIIKGTIKDLTDPYILTSRS